ncbi:MAG TPA: non-heme iron oxygenase ferredoxin subunit [Candidatus Dormibacteraeota bacterium]|nr:non-heme iron oxygenase ferredoxin subunit [Candidatus Dormibacteraeota bacterium]
MTTKHLVGKVSDLAVDSMRKVVLDGEEICLAHAGDGSYYAIGDVCTHEEYSLSEGELWALEVECPAHGSRFDLRTGTVTGLPAVIPARVYPVTVEGDDVYVEL